MGGKKTVPREDAMGTLGDEGTEEEQEELENDDDEWSSLLRLSNRGEAAAGRHLNEI